MDTLLDPLNSDGQNTIQRLAKEHAVIVVPWHKTEQHVPLGTTFYTSRSKGSDPWASHSPFEKSHSPNILFSSAQSSGGFFRTSTTSKSTAKTDHMSIGGGVTVGCRFAKASVSGSYDKDLSENTDSRKMSLHARERHGSIFLSHVPSLTRDAETILRGSDGLSKFEEKYGDYVLVAYSIGGDTGLLLSENQKSSSETEAKRLKITVKVVGIEKSKTTNEFFSRASASSELSLHAFDTLGNDHLSSNTTRVDETEKQRLAEKSAAFARQAANLSRRVNQLSIAHGLRNGMNCSDELCRKLAQSGLVIELVLRPLCRMRQVVDQTAGR